MKVRLLVADNDGTLVTEEHKFTERTKAALEKAHQQGILVGMASGRTSDDIRGYARAWGLSFDFDIAIGYNGCELWDGLNNKLYSQYFLEEGAIEAIIKMMAPLNLPVQIHKDDLIYVNMIDDEVRRSMERNHSEDRTILLEDLSIVRDWRLPKIMYRVPQERMSEVEEWVKQHPSPLYKGFRTQKICYEFSNPLVDKGYSLKLFCQLNDIDLNEVVAFGDTTNDNEMLACCYGVCVASSTQDTIACSKYVSPYTNDEDAVAHFIEDYVLK